MRIIAVANQKGGCGKTTTSIHLASCLALLEKKVLIVDLDPQGHSTCGLGIKAEELPYGLYDLMSERTLRKAEFRQVLVELNPYLGILPSHVILGAVEEELASQSGKEKRLKNILAQAVRDGFACDYVIMDCPPNLGVLTFNAFEAAQEVIIPVEPSFFSLHGLAKITETIRYFNHRKAVPLEMNALLTLFDVQSSYAAGIYAEIKKHFGRHVFSTLIHQCQELKEAASAGVSIDQFDRESQGFKDYYALAVEYLKKEWERQFPAEELGWFKMMQKRLGPRRVIGGVLFQLQAQGARDVEIAGDFNQWIPESMMMRDLSGVLWQKVIPIPTKSSAYKFIVDGEWKMDPFHKTQSESFIGVHNSVWIEGA